MVEKDISKIRITAVQRKPYLKNRLHELPATTTPISSHNEAAEASVANLVPHGDVDVSRAANETVSLTMLPSLRRSKRKVDDASSNLDSTQTGQSFLDGTSGVNNSVSRKRRKPSVPQPSPAHILAHSRLTSASAPQIQSSEPPLRLARTLPERTEPTTSLLENAAASAATVSDLAISIEGCTRLSRRNPSTTESFDKSPYAEDQDRDTAAHVSQKRKFRSRKDVEEAATEVVAAALGERKTSLRRRRRNLTPDEADSHEIVPAQVKMSELCRDGRVGKKSTTETEMQNLGTAALKRAWREQVEHLRNGKRQSQNEAVPDNRQIQNSAPMQPLMTVENGQIVINPESTEIDPHQGLQEDAERQDNVIEERAITKRVNQMTVGKRSGIWGPGTRWDEEMTDLFYKGIRMFGTDLMMISSLFPGLTRRHIKLKYIKEERTNLSRLQHNLANRDPIDMNDLESKTEKVYIEDPTTFLAELEAERERAEAAERERLATGDEVEGLAEEIILPSLELRSSHSADPGVEAPNTDAVLGDVQAKERRFDSIARTIVRQASKPKKKRKPVVPPKKKKDTAKRAGRTMEGVEERLGTVDEVTR